MHPPPPTHWKQLANLLDDLSHLPLHTPKDNFHYLIEGLSELVHATSAFCVFARKTTPISDRDILNGWRPIEVTYINPTAQDQKVRKIIEATIENQDETTHEGLRAHMPHTGKHRSMLWSELIPGQRLTESEKYDELFAPMGIIDRMFGILNIDPQLEVYFCMDRSTGQELFDEDDRAFITMVLSTTWPHTIRYCQSMGFLEEQECLSPREQETLELLLQGFTEKEIAAKLGVTPRSAHQYVTIIYRKLKVNSRAQLMSRWLSPPTYIKA